MKTKGGEAGKKKNWSDGVELRLEKAEVDFGSVEAAGEPN